MAEDGLMANPNAFEFFATPEAYTSFLFRWCAAHGISLYGRLFEPCVGDGAIVQAASKAGGLLLPRIWRTNDLDPRWPADTHLDARGPACWSRVQDWSISNPPFGPAVEIIDFARRHSEVGAIMHLRISIHEVLKSGIRRTWLQRHPPTGLLFLPRFAFQRSKTTGKWTTDSATTAWTFWLRGAGGASQFIDYADEQCLDDLAAETFAYRERMDAIMAERGELVKA